MSADLTFFNLPQEDMSEDSVFGLKVLLENSTTSLELIKILLETSPSPFIRLLTQILQELLTPTKFKAPSEMLKFQELVMKSKEKIH